MGMPAAAKSNATHDGSPASATAPASQARLFIVLFLGLGLALLFVVGVVVAGVGLMFVLAARPRPSTQVVSSAPALPAGWKAVSYPAGWYSIALPGNIESGGREPGSIVHGYTPDGCIASVSYFDFPERHKIDRDVAMKSTADGHVNSAQGRETQRSKVWALGVSGVEVSFESTYEGRPCLTRLRVFETKNRLYTLSWLTPDSAKDGSASDIFFDSFKIEHASALTGSEKAKAGPKRRPGSPTFSGR